MGKPLGGIWGIFRAVGVRGFSAVLVRWGTNINTRNGQLRHLEWKQTVGRHLEWKQTVGRHLESGNGECEDTKIVETEYKQTVGRHQELGNRARIRNKVRGNRQTLGIHSECRNRKTMGIKTPRA